MLITILSGVVYGVQSRLIQVEVDVSQGLPCFQIVGLPGSEVREAKERVKVALKNVGVKLPPVCINVNLSPADLPKNGTMFDLPVAVGIMTALGEQPGQGLARLLAAVRLNVCCQVSPQKPTVILTLAASSCGKP